MKKLQNLAIFLMAVLIGACNKDPLENPNTVPLSKIDSKSTFSRALDISIKSQMNDGCDVYVNGSVVSSDRIVIDNPGFYSFVTKCGDKYDTTLFVLLDPERGESEWGLGTWVPKKWTPDYTGNYQLSYVRPSYISEGIDLPVVFIAHNGKSLLPLYDMVELQGQEITRLKRGVGSVHVPNNETKNPVSFKVGNHEGILSVGLFNTEKKILAGNIERDTLVAAFSSIHVTQDLIIAKGVTFSIPEGCELLVDEGVNIVNEGRLVISGSNKNPVHVTCSENNKYWGGIISRIEGNEVVAKNVIFSKSGFHDSQTYQYGHARRQALFYSENSLLRIDSCYFIDHIGQVFYPINSTLEIKNSLVQRVKTGGQVNQSVLTIENCVFTDFPDDNQMYAENDNDGLYINQSEATIINSAFMHAKDDGIDSGADGGGSISITDCFFESNFHEGLALSSGGANIKKHIITRCTIANCGQGIELGYSSPNHNVIVDSCLVYENHLGIRYGDNYTYPIQGNMLVKNSKIIDNENKDIWNMLRETWRPIIHNMVFENCTVSIADIYYPDLIIEN